jgi:release factor glutamine methyltransferase
MATKMVEAGQAILHGLAEPLIVDVGTGSGVIALALARARNARVVGTDVSARAVRAARRNARRAGLMNVEFRRGSLLAPVMDLEPGSVDLVIASLPHVAEGCIWGHQVPWPRRTVVGLGPDALDWQRGLIAAAVALLKTNGALVLKVWNYQWPQLTPYMKDQGYRVLNEVVIEGPLPVKAFVGVARLALAFDEARPRPLPR